MSVFIVAKIQAIPLPRQRLAILHITPIEHRYSNTHLSRHQCNPEKHSIPSRFYIQYEEFTDMCTSTHLDMPVLSYLHQVNIKVQIALKPCSSTLKLAKTCTSTIPPIKTFLSQWIMMYSCCGVRGCIVSQLARGC